AGVQIGRRVPVGISQSVKAQCRRRRRRSGLLLPAQERSPSRVWCITATRAPVQAAGSTPTSSPHVTFRNYWARAASLDRYYVLRSIAPGSSERMEDVPSAGLAALGRFSEPALLILVSLADGPKHGYAMVDDIQRLSGTCLGPGTLYGAIARLERLG